MENYEIDKGITSDIQMLNYLADSTMPEDGLEWDFEDFDSFWVEDTFGNNVTDYLKFDTPND